jgi:transposase InsO family protein
MQNHDSQMGRWIVEFGNYSMILLHRAGQEHINADFWSRVPELVDSMCNYFREDIPLESLPCHTTGPNGESIPCKKCKKMKEEWSDFDENVDDTLPLAGIIKKISLDFSHLDPEQNVSISLRGVSDEELRLLQQQDYDFGPLITWLEEGKEPTEGELTISSPALRHYWSVKKQFVFKEGVLYFRWEDLKDSRLLLCIPESVKDLVFFYCHDSMWEGHPGEIGTKQEVLKRFYWRGASTDCELYCKTCPECAMCKYKNRRRKGKMVSRHAGYPMQRCHTDVIGPISVSESGNSVILMIIDQFTKFVAAIPLPNQKGATLAKAFVGQFCTYFGVPVELHSDNGKSFIEGIFQEATKRLQIQRSSTCLYFPSANGAIERQNLTLMSKVRTILKTTRDFKNWDEYVPYCAAAIRATPNRMTKFTPNFLMFGRELNMPADIAFGFPHRKTPKELSKFVRELVQIMMFAWRKAREHIGRTQRRMKRDHDRKSYDPGISIGDIVFVENTKRRKKKLSAKILPLFKGPMLVIGKINPVVFWLQYKSKIIAEHYNKIIPDNTGFFPPWLLKLRAKLFKGDPKDFIDANRNRLGMPVSDIRKLYDADDLGDKSLLDHIKVIRKPRGPRKVRQPKSITSRKVGRGVTKKKFRTTPIKPTNTHTTQTHTNHQDQAIDLMDPFLDFQGPTSTQAPKPSQDPPQDPPSLPQQTLPPVTLTANNQGPTEGDKTTSDGVDQDREWVDEAIQVPSYEIKRNMEEAVDQNKKVPPIVLRKKRTRRKNPRYYNAQFYEY